MNLDVGLAVFTSPRPHYYFIRKTSEHRILFFSEDWVHYTVDRSQKADFQLLYHAPMQDLAHYALTRLQYI